MKMIKMENYYQRKKRGFTDLIPQNHDDLWDTKGEFENLIRETVNIMIDELGAQISEQSTFLSVTINNKGFEFMRSLFRIRYANIPANPLENPFYNVSILLHKYSAGENTYKFDNGQARKNTVDALALLIDKLKEEIVKTNEKRPQFLVEPYFWDVITKHQNNPTAESYRLRKTLSRQFQEESRLWKEKRKAYNAQYRDTLERLDRIKAQLPHSINVLKSLGGKVIKRGSLYRAVLPLENGEVKEGMLERLPYTSARMLLKDLPIELREELKLAG